MREVRLPTCPRFETLFPLLAPLVVILAWLPAAGAPYHYDDFNTPVGDPASQSIGSWLQTVPQTLRPLTKLTYAVESSLGAVDAPARRVFNAVVFGACTATLAGLMRLAGVPRLLALLFGVLWAVHPVHAETIVALAGRPVLVALFCMLASAWLLLELRPKSAIAFAFLALLARESALPWVLVCSAFGAGQLGWSRTRIVATTATIGAAGVLTILSVRTLQSLLVSTLSAAGAYDRLGLQWAALFHGTTSLFVAPGSFTLDMDFAPVGAERFAMILGSVALYAAALYLALRERHPFAVRVLAWLWLSLVIPTHSVVPKVDVFTARPFSASLAPLLALLALLVTGLLARAPRARPWWYGLTVVGTCALAAISNARATLYQDSVALWRDAAARSTHNTRPLINLSTHLIKRGRLAEARSALEEALQRNTQSFETRARLGIVLHLLEAEKMSLLNPGENHP